MGVGSPVSGFVGDKGGEAYLKLKYGYSSDELKSYNNSIHDYDLFSKYMVNSVRRLNQFYADSVSLYSLEEKRKKTTKTKMD